MADERYRVLFEQSLDAIIVTDREGRIVELNSAAMELFRLSREMLPRFDTGAAFVKPGERAHLAARLDEDGGVRGHETQLRRADGTTFPALYSGRVLRDARGEVAGRLEIVRDVTELVDARAARDQARQQPDDARPAEPVARADAATQDYSGRESVLVVEDEAPVRSLMCITLRRLGYTVIEAKNAADALMLLGEFSDRVHLVVTDLVMPDVGGAELIEALRVSRPWLKVLFISGYSRDFASARGATPGAPFLQKPFTMATFARVVRETLDRTDVPLVGAG